MPREDRGQLHLGVHHQADHEQVLHQARRLAHVVVERVVDQLAVADARVAAQAGRVECVGVVMADGLHAADAGQYALAPAAEARHDVVRRRAQADHLVRLRRQRVDPDRGIVRGGAQVDQVGRIAIVIDHAHPVEDFVGHQRAQFLLVAAVVRAVGHQDGQVAVRYAAGVYVVHQRGNHPVLPHPEARHVADDQRHPVARSQPLLQRGQVDRRLERARQRGGNVLDRRHMVSVQLAQHLLLVQREADGSVAISERIIFHLIPPQAMFCQYSCKVLHARIISRPASFVEAK